MSRPPLAIQAEMLALSLPGYTRSTDSIWAAQLLPAATEAAHFEATAEAMATEIDPRSAFYMLTDWQKLFGPDPYGIDTIGMSTAQRQAYYYQRLLDRGGQSIAFFVGLGAALGETISITESPQTVYGTAVYGRNVYCESPNQFMWRVNLPPAYMARATYGSARYGDCYGTITPNPVVPLIKALAPAHTLPVFSYASE